jgi:CRP-like cAMP-binding protein
MKTLSLRDAWRGEADCRNCSVRTSVLFAGLDEADFDDIHRPIDELMLPSHSTLYHSQAPGEAVFTIRNGLLKLVQYLPDGTQRIVRLLRGTDVTGLEALLGQPYQHDAVVLQTASICRIPVDVVRALDRDKPGLRQELMCRWQRALSEADAWLTELSTGTARQRVARLLLRLLDDRGQGLCELFSREDIGAMLGLTTETASRVVAEFKRNGVLIDGGAGRFACDAAALNRLTAD